LDLLFRHPHRDNGSEINKDELFIYPKNPKDKNRRDLALICLESGPGAFLSGPGPITRILVQADPTLDDLLAATFVEELLCGRELPDGARSFARYAALA